MIMIEYACIAIALCGVASLALCLASLALAGRAAMVERRAMARQLTRID